MTLLSWKGGKLFIQHWLKHPCRPNTPHVAPAAWDKPLRDIYKNDKELEASNLPENVPVKCLNSTGCAGKLQLIKCCWHERVKWGSVLILWKPCAAYFRYFSALTPDSNEWLKVNHLTGVLEQLLHLQHAGQGLVSSQCHVLNLRSSSKELDSRTFLKSLSYLWSEIPASQAICSQGNIWSDHLYNKGMSDLFFTDWQVCLYWLLLWTGMTLEPPSVWCCAACFGLKEAASLHPICDICWGVWHATDVLPIKTRAGVLLFDGNVIWEEWFPIHPEGCCETMTGRISLQGPFHSLS